jgi:hypothetical protein
MRSGSFFTSSFRESLNKVPMVGRPGIFFLFIGRNGLQLYCQREGRKPEVESQKSKPESGIRNWEIRLKT